MSTATQTWHIPVQAQVGQRETTTTVCGSHDADRGGNNTDRGGRNRQSTQCSGFKRLKRTYRTRERFLGTPLPTASRYPSPLPHQREERPSGATRYPTPGRSFRQAAAGPERRMRPPAPPSPKGFPNRSNYPGDPIGIHSIRTCPNRVCSGRNSKDPDGEAALRSLPTWHLRCPGAAPALSPLPAGIPAFRNVSGQGTSGCSDSGEATSSHCPFSNKYPFEMKPAPACASSAAPPGSESW